MFKDSVNINEINEKIRRANEKIKASKPPVKPVKTSGSWRDTIVEENPHLLSEEFEHNTTIRENYTERDSISDEIIVDLSNAPITEGEASTSIYYEEEYRRARETNREDVELAHKISNTNMNVNGRHPTGAKSIFRSSDERSQDPEDIVNRFRQQTKTERDRIRQKEEAVDQSLAKMIQLAENGGIFLDEDGNPFDPRDQVGERSFISDFPVSRASSPQRIDQPVSKKTGLSPNGTPINNSSIGNKLTSGLRSSINSKTNSNLKSIVPRDSDGKIETVNVDNRTNFLEI